MNKKKIKNSLTDYKRNSSGRDNLTPDYGFKVAVNYYIPAGQSMYMYVGQTIG